MSKWMQIGSVSTAELSINQAEALEKLSDRGDNFIEVIDGDWSLQREVDLTDIIAADELIERIEEGLYAFVCIEDGIEIDAEALEKLTRYATATHNGYWSGTKVFQIDPEQLRRLYAVYPDGSDMLWIGKPSDLPFEIVKDNIPLSSDDVDEGEDGYEHVNQPELLHEVLITGENPEVSAWNDNAERDAHWFEWRSLDS